MKKLIPTILLAFMLLPTFPVFAAIDGLAFKDASQEKRYRKLAEELRCLVCQNQSLADSNADLARDLRVELLRLINEDRSDQEITEYLVARYGDFVRYKPPFKATTWLLWLGPLLILVFAGISLARVVREKQKPVLAEQLSTDDSARLNSLLTKNQEGDS